MTKQEVALEALKNLVDGLNATEFPMGVWERTEFNLLVKLREDKNKAEAAIKLLESSEERQPVLSFEEWWNYTYPDICFIEKDTASMLFIREAFEAGCNQPGEVKDASPPTVEQLNELYELSDEPTIQGNEFYLRGFKDRETWQTKPVEGDVRELNKIIEDVLDKFDNSSLSDLVPSRLLKISKAGRIVDALLSKFNFTRKG